MEYVTEDGVTLNTGDRAYDYYSMKPGYIERDAGNFPDPWFDFKHDDGTITLLNGQRICSMEYAVKRGFKGAASTSERETVIVGYDGHSNPMVRYKDEMHLPEHLRTVVNLPKQVDNA